MSVKNIILLEKVIESLSGKMCRLMKCVLLQEIRGYRYNLNVKVL